MRAVPVAILAILLGATLWSTPVRACDGENCEETSPVVASAEEGGASAGVTEVCPGITGTLISLGGGKCIDK